MLKGMNARSIKYQRGGLYCPITRNCRTAFMDLESYQGLCRRCQSQKVPEWNGVVKTLYKSICSKCPNSKNKKIVPLHQAEIMDPSVVAAIKAKFSREVTES